MSVFYPWERVTVRLLPEFGSLVVGREVKVSDPADLFEYERVDEYVSVLGSKVAHVPIGAFR